MNANPADAAVVEEEQSGFLSKLLDRHEVARGTMAFEFEKPAGWTFVAGQSVDITLLDPPQTDAEGDKRAFSIASAPNEPNIMVATRMRDTAFKNVLRTLPLGTQVKIEGPFGDLKLHNNPARPAVIMSGGIGVTPFRSILKQAATDKRPHRIYFLYANRTPEDAPFLEEMRALATQNPNMSVVPVMAQAEESEPSWDGERGLIDGNLLHKYLLEVSGAIYYITGPPAMVKAMREVLTTEEVDDDDIRTEEFTGY